MAFHLFFRPMGAGESCDKCKKADAKEVVVIFVSARSRYEQEHIIVHRECLNRSLRLAEKKRQAEIADNAIPVGDSQEAI